MAIAALITFAVIPHEFYARHSKKLISGLVLLLIMTFFVSETMKGANRWISFYIFTIQPSEIAKIVIVIHLAYLINKKSDVLQNFKQGFIYPLFWVLLLSVLVLIQPKLSAAIMIMLSSFTLLYVGGAKFKHVMGTLSVLALPAFGIMMLLPYARGRIMNFVNSLMNGGYPNDQVYQAKVALGSGGMLGVGIGHSRQSDLFIPEAYGDFIFSVLGEELGLIGTVGVLAIYLTIFIIGFSIARNADTKFGQLLAFGLSFNIILGAFINAAVVMGLVPTTGVTLPFISYGGTSMTFMAASIGIIINIGRNSVKQSVPETGFTTI
jgi:cell division protein FtsW